MATAPQPTPIWQDERYTYPAAAVALAFLALLPLLGGFGLWDPHEISIADLAREAVRTGNWDKLSEGRPPLTMWLVATSIKWFGVSEFSARAPLAIFGVIGVAVTYVLGARLARPRVGLIAAIVLVSSPLYLFQSRQLMSDVVSVACTATAMLGLVGIVWPRGNRYRVEYLVIDALLAVAGLVLGMLSSGLVLGVIVPIGSIVLAALLGLGARMGADEVGPGEPTRLRLKIASIAGGAVVVVLLFAVFIDVFDFVSPQPGQTVVGGKALVASKSYSALLGGVWRPGDPPATATFDYLIEQVAFGMFPWSAILPIALLRLAIPRRRDREAWGGLAVLSWTLFAYVLGALFVRRVTEIRFPALAGLAVGMGLFIDHLLAVRLERKPAAAPAFTGAMPLALLFVGAAVFQLARDCVLFPEELAAVHVLKTIKYPVEMRDELLAIPFFAGLFGIAFGMLLVVRGPRDDSPGERIYRELNLWAARAAVGVPYAFAVFLAVSYTPALSQHFSYRNLFESYFDHRTGSETLGVMGIPGSGPEYYAHGPFEKLNSLGDLQRFLKNEPRVFAIAPADKLCTLHQSSATQGFTYHVLDNRNSRFLLLTNRLSGKERDQNPLLTAFRETPPASIRRTVHANYENTIELLGADMPERVDHGDKFKMTLWFKVLQKPRTNYKIFVHFDGMGVRFQGDHDPIGGRCGTTFWQPGDYVADTFEVEAGQLANPRGRYEVWVGFFTGGSNQWKNMQVVEGNKDSNNRVSMGHLQVQ